MHQGFRFLQWATRSERRAGKSRQSASGLSPYHRRLRCEPLEDRRLLSVASPQIDLFNASSALFAQNEGQWADQSVRYAFNGSGASILFTDAGLNFQVYQSPASDSTNTDTTIESERFSIQFNGASQVAPVGLDEAETVFNYFVGDQSQWHSGVATYQTVAYNNLYAGIDLDISGRRTSLKYEFHVAAGADYQQIAVSYAGIEGLSIDSEGALHVQTKLGELVDDTPYIYQEIDGQKVEVAGQFVLLDDHTYTFQVTGSFDSSRELVIDPNLAWSTYLGGSGDDYGNGIAVDTTGNVYVTGETYSSNFPATAGAFDTAYNGGSYDVFVAKLDANGSGLVYTTYLGGSGDDYGYRLAVDTAGNAYVTGTTSSSNFPTTTGAFDTTYSGNSDVFVVKLNASGSGLVYATYLGGTSSECDPSPYDSYDPYSWAHIDSFGIAIDVAGNAYVTGWTKSSDFPTTTGAFDTTYNGGADTYPVGGDAFVAKLNASGSGLVYSTYLGGTGDDRGIGIAVDATGNAYVTGETYSSNFPTTAGAFDTTFNGTCIDAFVAKLNASGSSLVYSTYLGGSGSDSMYDDRGEDIAVDATGNAYVTGWTCASDFPTTAGAFDTTHNGLAADAFVAKFNVSGSDLEYSTYLGGSHDDKGYDIAVDSAGNACLTGWTTSSDFPTTAGAFDTTYDGLYSDDVFVVRLDASGSGLTYSTYLGGSNGDVGRGIALDAAGNAYVAGVTACTSFPTTTDAFDTTYNGGIDAFVAKITGLAATQNALERQIQQISYPTFDGAGDDLTITLGNVGLGRQVEVLVGQTASDLRSIGTFTNTTGDATWSFSVDIHDANISLAQFVAVTSSQSPTILSAVALHSNVSDWVDYTSYPSLASALPSFSSEDYQSVATLYRWDWDQKMFVALPESSWTNSDAIDWSHQTIILTHGWNSSYTTDFIGNFADDFMVGRSLNGCKAFNILAVDWYDGGSSKGSDPNNNSSDISPADAWKSSKNGILAGESLANRLMAIVGDDLNPENMMLIGHSNGAGFMASMALVWKKATGKAVAELDTLDAPAETLAWQEVVCAVAAGIQTSNYYMAIETLGFGLPIFVPGKENVLNFGMDYTADLSYAVVNGLVNSLPSVMGHSLVALCYAETADNSSPSFPWGFQESGFINGDSPFDYCRFWIETDIPGCFIPNFMLDAATSTVDNVIEATQTAWDAIATATQSIWDAGVRVADNVAEALKGVNTCVLASADYLSIYAQAHSAVLASIDVNIPANAALLEFTLSVLNPGNSDRLLVAVGDDVLQEIDLADAQSAGGLKAQLWMKQYAGQSTTVTFYMPSEESSSAEFLISDVQFAEVNMPPQATFDSSAVMVGDAAATFAVTYADPDGATLESTIDDNDILVTSPNGFSQHATLVSVNSSADGSSRTATYQIVAPGEAWTSTDAGTYIVTMQANQVSDDNGGFVAEGALGIVDVVVQLTVTINQAPGQADTTNVSPINFMVVFSESVSDFATGDVTLSGTAGATTAVVTGSGTTYNVAVSGMKNSGAVIAGIAAGKTHDAAGNPNAASTSTDNSVAYNAGPTIAGATVKESNSSNKNGKLEPTDVLTLLWSAKSGSGIASQTVKVDGKAVKPIKAISGGSYYFCSLGKRAAGTHSYTIKTTDSKGRSSNVSGTFTVVAPAPPIIASATVKESNSSNKNGKLESTDVLTLLWSAKSGSGIASQTVKVDGKAVKPIKAISGGSYYFCSLGKRAAGTHSYTIKTTDSKGRSSNVSGTFTVVASASAMSSAARAGLLTAVLDEVNDDAASADWLVCGHYFWQDRSF